MGAVARYLVSVAFAGRGWTGFPWHTLVVNLVGAFLLGFLMVLVSERGVVAPEYALLLGTGVLGGFTTFSALSYETLVLMQAGSPGVALGNAFGSAGLGLVCAWLGVLAGRAV